MQSSAADCRQPSGAALAFKMRNEPRVSLAFFGDGATNIGTFHESMNLAQLWQLPVVFVCENNHWSESTPQSQHQPIRDLTQRAAAYGMHALHVDGQDVEAVHLAAIEALEHARSGKGPVFLLCETERLDGHYIGDAQVYRDKDELRRLRATRDPIHNLRERLELSGEEWTQARRRGAACRRCVGRVREGGNRPGAGRRAQVRLLDGVVMSVPRSSKRMDVRLKRAYEPPAASDGYRVLIDRLWPRGIRRDAARLDEWARELAPSGELRRWFGHDPERFEEFRRRYTAELAGRRRSYGNCAVGREHGPLTLVYGAHDEEHNDAVVLAQILRSGRRSR